MNNKDGRVSYKDARYLVFVNVHEELISYRTKKEAVARAKELARRGTVYVLKKVAGYQPAVEKIEETGNE